VKIDIDNIIVGDRVRQDAGDLTVLKQSIKAVGLINPIVINEYNELLTGFRRLQACKELGLSDVEVKILKMEGDKILELDWEYHENLGRKDLNAEDKQSYFEERDKLLNPPQTNRIVRWIKALWNKVLSLFR
jgi:ParB family transcriptional regulator, chromosome partitioning protein